ncbi:MAG: hypothetical protein SH856_09395 [Flavobacteriales bacterium]|nr:hypothetical protein [Flavobacteriales bacterium]
MKKTTIFMFLVVAAMATVNAQTTPNNYRTEFDTKYPNSNASWKNENGYNNAYFNDDTKRQRMVSYDQNGRMVSNGTMISPIDVPVNINAYHKKNYPTDSGYRVWRDEMNGTTTYYSVTGTNRYYFDRDGNYIRTGNLNDARLEKNPE